MLKIHHMPRTKTKPEPSKSSQLGTKTGEERYTIVSTSEAIEDMKNIAYWKRLKIKEVYTLSISNTIENFKADKANKAHVSAGKIKQRPEGE